MGMFSGLFGGGGSAKRAAGVEAAGFAQAKKELLARTAQEQEKFDPYLQGGQAALGQTQDILGGVGDRISAIDPRIEELYGEKAALQPQAQEIYGLAQQQDPIVQEILGGGQGFEQSPGYQFRLQQGQQALERSQSAKGGLLGGAAVKEAIRYGQGFGSDEYQNYLNSLNNQLGAVNTQIGGRQQALGAGYNQMAAGVNLIGQERGQIESQLQQSQGYQPLLGAGLGAAGQSANLGYGAAQSAADLTTQRSQAIAGGMRDKAAQLGASGSQWLKLAGTALGGALGGPMGASLGGSLGGQFGGASQAGSGYLGSQGDSSVYSGSPSYSQNFLA